SCLAFPGTTTDEVRRTLAPELRIPNGGPQVRLLIDDIEQGLARSLVAKRRMQMIGAQPTLSPHRINDAHRDIGVFLKLRYKVYQWVFPVIDFPGRKGRTGRRRVGDIQPLDAIHIDLFTASAEAGRLSTRHIIGVADVDDAVPRLPFLWHELEGTGADDLLDLLIGWRPCQACWHDEGDIATRFG